MQIDINTDPNLEQLVRFISVETNPAALENIFSGIVVGITDKLNVIRSGIKKREDERDIVFPAKQLRSLKKSVNAMNFVKYSERTFSVPEGFTGNLTKYLTSTHAIVDNFDPAYHEALGAVSDSAAQAINSSSYSKVDMNDAPITSANRLSDAYIKNKGKYHNNQQTGVLPLYDIFGNQKDIVAGFTAYSNSPALLVDRKYVTGVMQRVDELDKYLNILLAQLANSTKKDAAYIRKLGSDAYMIAILTENLSSMIFDHRSIGTTMERIYAIVMKDFGG